MIVFNGRDILFWGFCRNPDDASTTEVDHVIDVLKSCEYDVVYVHVSDPTADDLSRFATLAPLVDHKLVYEKPRVKAVSDRALQLAPYQGSVTNALIDMACAAGHQSRFYVDPHFALTFADYTAVGSLVRSLASWLMLLLFRLRMKFRSVLRRYQTGRCSVRLV